LSVVVKPGARNPSATPRAMAAKIQTVRNRSRNESFPAMPAWAESFISVFLEAPNQRFESSKCAWFKAITDTRPVDVATNHPDILQNLQVLRHG
jgi:hypothetical protein